MHQKSLFRLLPGEYELGHLYPGSWVEEEGRSALAFRLCRLAIPLFLVQ